MFVYKNKKFLGVLLVFVLIIMFFVKDWWLNNYFGVKVFIPEDFGKLNSTDIAKNSSENSMNLEYSQKIVILIWKYGIFLKNRHIHRFHPTKRFSPWKDCPMKKPCEVIYSENLSIEADAVLFHLHKMTRSDAIEIYDFSRKKRKSEQIWGFLTDESPLHTIIYPEYNDLFNFSMTYRSDSDVWVPYGRTLKKSNSSESILPGKFPKKTKLAAVMGSNCSGQQISGSRRWNYVKSLLKILEKKTKYITQNKNILKVNTKTNNRKMNIEKDAQMNIKINSEMDMKMKKAIEFGLEILGKCLNGNVTACPGHFAKDCPLLDEFKFYLAFENSNCREYITEKVFWNSYSKFSVPVIMGAPKDDCQKLLPPNSFIHVDDFSTVNELANYLVFLGKTDEEYMKFHNWRKDFVVVNEHGYFGTRSWHYCRLCEALNRQNFGRKTYHDLEVFWNKNDCHF